MPYTQRALAAASVLLLGVPTAALADTISGTDFEGGSLSGWNKGTQSGTLTNGTITGNGTGVTLINGAVTFSAPSHPAVGNPTVNGAPNPYYQPAVTPTTWTFSPYGSYGAALQPQGNVTFDAATSALGLTQTQNQAIKTKLQQDQQASGLGNPNPTNAAWLTQNVTLNAGTTYTMSWNYIGTDYVPFNDGSITSLVYQGTGSTPVVTVNNYVQNYALLGFTNPGTGDYSTGTYGSTGWQSSTYQVDVTGAYLLGFAVFNLGDTALSPVLLVDSQPGTTLKNGQTFGAVAPNNPNAPNANQTPAPPATPTPPTIVSSAAGTPIVTTSSSSGSRTVTSTQGRTVMGTDANGNQTETYYTDIVTTTIPTITTVTTTTPTTVDTYSDGSTVTTNGTPTSSSSTSDSGSGTSVVTQANVSDWVKTRTYDVQRTAYAPSGAAPTVTQTHRFNATENGAQQKVNHHTTTGVTTPTVRTVTTTPVYTKVYTNGSPNVVTNDPSVITYETSTSYAEYYASRDYFGRIDQLEVMDKVSDGINGLLNHEPSRTKQKFRVFDNNRFVQSYNADGYTADAKIFGGGFELDLSKGWTIGAQYNQVNVNLDGVDSKTRQKKDHVGIFNTFYGNTLTLNTNAAIAKNKYNYNRTVEGVFDNAGETQGQEWWVSNRLYLHATKWLKPFVGHTVKNVQRDAYVETGDIRSARAVEEVNQTTHVGEAGLKIETRFGGKKKNLFGVSVEGVYGTDNSYGASASVDYNEFLFVEGSYGVSDGVTTNSIAGKVKFRF